MKFYQLIFLGDTTCEDCSKVKERIFKLLTERGLDKGMVAVLDGTLTLTAKEAGGYDSAKPTFAFYFGRQGHSDKDVDALQKLMGNGARSCSMDFGCITPLYAFRMFGGQYSIEDIGRGLTEIREQGYLES